MDDLLAEATRLGAELEALVEEAASVSEQIDQAVVDVIKHTGNIGVSLFQAGAASRVVAAATGVGLGVAAVTWAVGKVTQARQEAKERKRLAEIAKKKEAIASIKSSSLEALLPKLERLRQRFEEGVVRESGRHLSQDLWPRGERLREGLMKMFTGLLESERQVAVARYLKAEFEAWLKGESSSYLPPPDIEAARDRCAYTVIEAARLPMKPRAMDMPECFTVGTYLLLAQPAEGMPEDVAAQMRRVSRALGVGRVLSALNRFSSTTAHFREFDNALLREDSDVGTAAGIVWSLLAAGLGAVVVLAALAAF